jgi:hypothetical protein
MGSKKLCCHAIDADTAVLVVRGQKMVLDYSELMDFLMDLASVASQVEGLAGDDAQISGQPPALH